MALLIKIVFCIATYGHFTAESIFLPYWKGRNHTLDSFHIPLQNLLIGNSVHRKTNDSLDKRCMEGGPLSIAWHAHAPYTMMYQSTFNKKKGFSVTGMFPGILTRMLSSCCHQDSTVRYGKLLRSARHAEESVVDDNFDITFPLFGYGGFRKSFRGHAFLPLVRVPGVILLLHDHQSPTRTHFLVTTIISAWPMLVFILLTASLSGIIIWFLDHNQNPNEFPPPFLRGAWEGFWWALVTMTTVGYGDRSPKSALGRVFCIVWIITGVIIVSIFTALVTASLSASTYPNFKVHGSKIGAVNGSEEFRLGISMNAEMKVYSNVMQITKDLLTNQIDGALVDNYVITHFLKFIEDEPIRIDKYINHPITFGAVLGSNSSLLEACMRQYIADYPHEIFESVAKHLTPLKNPTDDVSQQLKAAEALFYQEWTFIRIMYGGLGIVGLLFLAGIIWEFVFRRRGKGCHVTQKLPIKVTFNSSDETAKLQSRDNQLDMLDDMIGQYQVFHDTWMEKLKNLRDKSHQNNLFASE